MRGYPLFNWPWFEAAAKVIRAKGHEVVNPTEIDEELGVVEVTRLSDGTIWDVSLTDLYDFDLVIGRDLEEVVACDGIVLGPDWSHSEGANMERDAAIAAGLAIFYGVESVPDIADFDDPILCDEDLLRHQQRTATEQVSYVDEVRHPNGDVSWTGPASANVSGEVRVVDPKTGGEKGQKLARFDLLPPEALWAVAEHLGKGASKYEARNWERGYDFGLSYAAMQRHAHQWWGGEEIDDETGSHHLAAVATHALFLLTFVLRNIGTDDRRAA
jgi:hypothetical protein